MNIETLKPGSTVTGPLFPEPVQVIVCVPIGASVKLIGKGLDSRQVYEPVLDAEQLMTLEVSPEQPPFDADPVQFRLGVEALRLALAYEYDPYFSLSIARVDPLPHQLEAVFDYFIRTAERLRSDYWLCVVYHCATKPEIYTVRDPGRLGWKTVVRIEHYTAGPSEILGAARETLP